MFKYMVDVDPVGQSPDKKLPFYQDSRELTKTPKHIHHHSTSSKIQASTISEAVCALMKIVIYIPGLGH